MTASKVKDPEAQKRGRSSRCKGASGERELRDKLRELLGIDCSRGCQFKGARDSPDIKMPEDSGLYVECKRVEKLNLRAAVNKATEEAEDLCPIVCHRTNRNSWLITAELDNLPRLARLIVAILDKEQREEITTDGNGS